MRKISDPKELNEIYSKINNFIQQYIESHNILPSEIYKYVKKNMNRFLEKNNLNDIERIHQIVEDVISHRLGMEKDQVLSFNKFSDSMNESILSTSESTIEHEKVLADLFNTSVGHVTPIDTKYHFYEIKSFGEMIKAIVFSDEEIELLKKDISEKIKQQILSKVINIDSIFGVSLDFSLIYPMREICDLESIKFPGLNDENVYKLLSRLLPKFLGDDYRIYRSTPERKGNYIIWEVKDFKDKI